MRSFVSVALLLLALQLRGQEPFEVVRAYAESAYDSAYVSSLASQFLPITGESYTDQITCLRSELMATGMFSGIKTSLVNQTPGVYHLVITPEWKGNPEKFLVKEILLDDSFETEIRRDFMSRLKARGVNIGEPFAFTAITRSIGKALDDLEDSGHDNGDSELWVRAVLVKKNEIRLVVSKRKPHCALQ